MKEITIKVFEYSELSDKAKEKAREWYRTNCAWTYDEGSMLTETFEDILVNEGFENVEVEWSLSCCQGDGVAFFGRIPFSEFRKNNEYIAVLSDTDIRRLNYLDKEFGITLVASRNNYCRYTHYGAISANIDCDYDCTSYYIRGIELQKKALALLQATFSNYLESKCNELEKIGYDDIDYRNSDECIEEYLLDGDNYEFLEDGTKY